MQTDGSVAYQLTREGRVAMTLAPPLYGELTSFFLPKALILEDYVFGPSDEPLIPSLRARRWIVYTVLGVAGAAALGSVIWTYTI